MSTLLAEAVEKMAPYSGRRRPRRWEIPVGAAGLLAALTLAVAAAPAVAQGNQAQIQLGDEPSTAEDRQILLRFSRCVAERHPDQARATILADYTTEASRDATRRLAMGQRGCLQQSGALRFGGLLFAADMAETLLPAAAPRGSLAERAALNPAAAPFQAHDQSEMMSICLVRAVPAETEALLATEHGSAEEGVALRAIGPHIGPCLAAGAEMRLNRPGLRALLALAAYRLVQHNAVAAPAAAAGN